MDRKVFNFLGLLINLIVLTGSASFAQETAPETIKDCDDCPEMVVVPAGTFTMGSPDDEVGRNDDEGPQHQVTILQPFAVGKFEVTFAEWDACVEAEACRDKLDDNGWGRRRQPVINASWDHALTYVEWLSKTTGKTYRLLSESEWEYVARAGTSTPFATGQIITTDQANFDGRKVYGGSQKGIARRKTIPVGSFEANSFGVHDMHGNVLEWVQDCWHANYEGAPVDASARTNEDCAEHSQRGGTWSSAPRSVRSAVRDRYGPGHRNIRVGFRVARNLQGGT